MKVKDLQAGHLYKLRNDSAIRIQPMRPHPQHEVSIMKIWESRLFSPRFLMDKTDIDYLKQLYLYTGARRDDWSYNGVFKHHYFLVAGREILITSQSIKYLVNYDREI